jgi:hypothetical protein
VLIASPAWAQSADAIGFHPGVPGIAQGRTIGGKLAEAISVIDFGADPTGRRDSLPAFNAARAAAGQAGHIYVPDGTFTLSGQFQLSANKVSLDCQSKASVIKYAGDADIDSTLMVGSPSRAAFNIRVSGCTIAGSRHTTSAVHELRAAHVLLTDLTMYGATNCLLLEGGNTNEVEAPLCSGGDDENAPHPAATGVVFKGETDSLMLNPQMEEIVNTGIEFIDSVKNTIIGGTSEGNRGGVSLDKGSGSNTIISLDCEANPGFDYLDAGTNNRCINCGLTLAHITATASMTVIDGGGNSQITIDPGAVGVTVENTTFGNVSGAITDRGTRTTLHNNRNANGGAFWTEKIAGIEMSNDLKTMGFGVEPATTDDPNGYTPAFTAAAGFFKLGAGPRTFPTCDATHGHGDVWYDAGAPAAAGSLRACIKDAQDAWSWRTLYSDGSGYSGTDSYPTGCSLKTATGTACANAGCTSTVPVVTSVSIVCPTAARAFRNGVAQP